MTDDQPKKPTIVSRQDLYAQVWQTPIMQLAEQYGISGNGLAKICKRLVIPGGDVRTALRTTLIANAFLQAEVDLLAGAVSPGFARGRIHRRRKTDGQEKKAV